MVISVIIVVCLALMILFFAVTIAGARPMTARTPRPRPEPGQRPPLLRRSTTAGRPDLASSWLQSLDFSPERGRRGGDRPGALFVAYRSYPDPPGRISTGTARCWAHARLPPNRRSSGTGTGPCPYPISPLPSRSWIPWILGVAIPET